MKFFSVRRSCVVASTCGSGSTGLRADEKGRGLGRHVLELVGDDIDVGGEAVERGDVGVVGARSRAHHVEGGESGSGQSTWHLKPSRAAASASMRPSWPPPRMPIVASGRAATRCMLTPCPSGVSATAVGLRCAPGVEPLGERRIGQRQHARGEQRRIDRAGLADRERADRHARRHLHDRQQRVQPRQRLAIRPARRTPAAASSRRSCRAGARRRPRPR